jgi:endonuclease/exonuclease/phosphatase family metal-dependent hydrolase
MRIGTYNIYGLRGYPETEAASVIGDAESPAAASHFQGVFRALACDILALQEGVSHRHMQRIALAIGCNLATFPSPLHWPGHLLIRYPIQESRVFSHASLHASAQPFSRVAGAACLELPDRARMWVFVVHLHPSVPELRAAEAAIVRTQALRLLADADHVVVLGDFNCELHEPVHRELQSLGFVNAMAAAGGGIAPTHPALGGAAYAIDHIYLSPSLRQGLTRAEVIQSEGFFSHEPHRGGLWVHSDHLPVVAEVMPDDEQGERR